MTTEVVGNLFSGGGFKVGSGGPICPEKLLFLMNTFRRTLVSVRPECAQNLQVQQNIFFLPPPDFGNVPEDQFIDNIILSSD